MYRLEIISAEQYQEILRRAAARKALFEPYFKMGAWLRRLAERSRNLEKKANTGASSEELSREAAAQKAYKADVEAREAATR